MPEMQGLASTRNSLLPVLFLKLHLGHELNPIQAFMQLRSLWQTLVIVDRLEQAAELGDGARHTCR
jgi:hypothetical protein